MADFSQEKKYRSKWRNSKFKDALFEGNNISELKNDMGFLTIETLPSSSTTFTGSFVTTSSFNTFTSSIQTQVNALTSDTSSYVKNSSTSSMTVLSASMSLNANNSSTLDIYSFSSPVESYLLMSNVIATSGVSVGGDSDLRYNSNTNTLTAVNIQATNITGSLFGTSSYSQTSSYVQIAQTASFITASNVIGTITSASNALTASYVAGLQGTGQYIPRWNATNPTQSGVLTNSSLFQDTNGNILIGTAGSVGSKLNVVQNSTGTQGVQISTTLSSSNVTSLNISNFGPGNFLQFDSGSSILKLTTAGMLTLTGSISATSGFTGSLQGTSSWANNAVTASFITASNVVGTVTSSSYALSASYSQTASYVALAQTSSYVNTLNQNVIITGSLTVATSSNGSGESTLVLGAAPAGGTGEGGQLALLATGGTYTSSSFIDTYQNQFRILKGTGTISDSGVLAIDLQTRGAKFEGAVTASAYSGLPNSWLYASRNSNQTIGSGTWANRDIIFNTYSSNNFTYNSSTGVATLKANKTYRITSRLAWSAAALYTLEFQIYNQTTSAYVGPIVELIQSPNGTYNVSDNTLEFIFAVGASDTDITIRTTSSTNALTGEYIRSDRNTQLIIQQIA